MANSPEAIKKIGHRFYTELSSLDKLHIHTKHTIITWVNGFVNLKTLTTAQLSPMNVSHKEGPVFLNGLLSRLIPSLRNTAVMLPNRLIKHLHSNGQQSIVLP